MRKRRGGGDNPEVELPITPMLDMAFQLLTFFIFTYNPSQLEGHMDMSLPATGEARAQTPQDVAPDAMADKAIAEPSEITIYARTHHDGLHNGELNYPIDVENFTGKKPVNSLPELTAYLKEINKDGANNAVKLKAESGLKWEGIVSVMDACNKAEFRSVGFSPPPDFEAKK
ncbi:MAG: ExbD/TolR family protein [Gemmataceae bacterium]